MIDDAKDDCVSYSGVAIEFILGSMGVDDVLET